MLNFFTKKTLFLFSVAVLLACYFSFSVVNFVDTWSRILLFLENLSCIFLIGYFLKSYFSLKKVEITKKIGAYVGSFLLLLVVYYFMSFFTGFAPSSLRTFVLLLLEYAIFGCILELKIALSRSKKVFQEYNQFKINEVEFKLNVLREQLNPHFLFNSLNVLKSLINIDPEKAVKYTVDLADLLRITIDSDKKETSVKEELDLCSLYLSIQNIRFNNNIFFNVALNPQEKHYKIPFLTLIILIENAIKHNVISTQEKLFINLTVENDYLVLKNNLNRKHHSLNRKGIGLESIGYRCKLLVNKDLEIVENKDYFSVKIPFKND